MAKRKEDTTIDIKPMTMGTMRCCVLFKTPLLMNRFQNKAWQELLLPRGRMNTAERAENLKHDPLQEFRESVYRNRDAKEPAYIHLPTGAFSKALAQAAVDVPGATKAAITRLVSCSSMQINLYGIPQMLMAMVRQSDMAHTPDVRTRAIFPEAACEVEFTYVSTLLKSNQIANLGGAAGQIVGIGDWRQEKGGPFGKYTIVDENNADFKRIVREQGRAAQLAALEKPVAFNADTEELYAWFCAEVARREKVVPSMAAVIADKALKRSNGKEKRT